MRIYSPIGRVCGKKGDPHGHGRSDVDYHRFLRSLRPRSGGRTDAIGTHVGGFIDREIKGQIGKRARLDYLRDSISSIQRAQRYRPLRDDAREGEAVRPFIDEIPDRPLRAGGRIESPPFRETPRLDKNRFRRYVPHID